jgi:hypothetical protein
VGNELQQNRYDQIIRRVGGIIGPGSKVSEALTELFPVLDVERVPGELLLLGGTHLSLGAAAGTGAVGETFRIQVFNPVDSGKLITVTSCIVSSTSSQQIRYATTIIALTTGIGTEVFRDRRLDANARPSGQIRTDSTVALTDAHGTFRLTDGLPVTLEDPNSLAVLPPGSGFEVGNTTTNTALLATFNWRERVAEQSELLFP